MAGRIPESFIETLNDRLNLVDVVGSRVTIRKTGKEYSGRCPFHDDSSPSFSVNPDKQVYHCFGCGASGGLIKFVMEFERVDFISAVGSLASLAGLEVPNEAEDPEAGHRKALYQILEQADLLFRKALKSDIKRDSAVKYLKNRGLTGIIAHRFGLGLAPNGWRFLFGQLGQDPEQKKLLVESGLTVINQQGREYDRFRDRIIFPIRDVRGRTIAFGGRVLDDSKPKYLNSPETKLFYKSDTLYGLYEARQACRSLDRVLIVEGYMDVVALAQYGIDFAVATLGTSLTSQHLDRLSRQTEQVIICFDGDQAGQTAAKRALDITLPFLTDKFSIRFLFLPDGHDPDSLVRNEGTNAFLTRLNDALPASEALILLLSKEVDLKKIDGRARLTALALPKIARVPISIYRSLMLDTLAELSGTRRSDLDGRLDDMQLTSGIPRLSDSLGESKFIRSEINSFDASSDNLPDDHALPADYFDHKEVPDLDDETPSQKLLMPTPETPMPLVNRLLWLLLQDPTLCKETFVIPENSRLVNIQALGEVFKWLDQALTRTTASMMGHFSGTELGRLLSKLLSQEALFGENSYEAEFLGGVYQLKKQLVTESMHQLAKDAKQGKISVVDLHQALAEHKK